MKASATGSGCSDIFIPRMDLYIKMVASGHEKLDDQVAFLKEYLIERTRCPEWKYPELSTTISYFIADFKKRWSAWNRTRQRFLTKNDSWLKTSISFPNLAGRNLNPGRPKLDFKEASDRTKRLKTQHLRSTHSTEELCYAAQMSLRSSGATDAAVLLKEVTTTSPSRAKRYKEAYKKDIAKTPGLLPTHEALSMFVEAKLTKSQYNVIRSKAKERFPSYKKIQEAKQECYPDKKYIEVTETGAEIELQGLLDHTVTRILQVQNEVLKSQQNLNQLVLISKWGFDGSSGHSEYKQKFTNGSYNDASVFMSSIVPLRLIDEDPEGPSKSQTILWNNTRASSTRFCRPIKFQFVQETVEVAKKEKEHIQNKINKLVTTKYETDEGAVIEITHKLLFTMVDGKTCNSLTDTKSTMKCFLCGLTSKEFNNISKCVNTSINQDNLEFGMSTLHAWIRFFECLINLSYKLPIQKWQARGSENKEIIDKRKHEIREKFKSELGLIIDKPKPGYGSSNDGNTARRFFENAAVSSEITGVDLEVIKRFRTILRTKASGYAIDLQRFKAYALESAHLFVEKYSWYCMPPTIHKVLIHGPVIIKKALLPIGQLSEEAQEANNKIFKRYREGYSRKISRVKTNEDIVNRLLISSDPLITSMQKPQKLKYTLDTDVTQLLQAPELDIPDTSDLASDDSADDD